MILYPPFQIRIKGTEINMGYGFLLDPPGRGSLKASVNAGVLFAQWTITILVGGAVLFLVRGNEDSQSKEQRIRNQKNKSFFESATFGFLRLIRGIMGFIFGLQIISLLPVISWFSDPSAINGNMIVRVVVKIIVLFLSGFLFFYMRKIIHRIHCYWYGCQHPSLQKSIAL